MWIDIFRLLCFIGLGSLSIILFAVGFRIMKVPNHVWEANRKNPCQANFNRIMEYVRGDR